jgi:hypothetical protein
MPDEQAQVVKDIPRDPESVPYRTTPKRAGLAQLSY